MQLGVVGETNLGRLLRFFAVGGLETAQRPKTKGRVQNPPCANAGSHLLANILGFCPPVQKWALAC